MTKMFLLEQCRRSRLADEEENMYFKEKEDSFWLVHNEGHAALTDEFEAILNSMDTLDVKRLKKWLKSQTDASANIIAEIDNRYDYVNEELSPEDEQIYAYHDGRDCMADLLLRILRKQKYLWKRNSLITHENRF